MPNMLSTRRPEFKRYTIRVMIFMLAYFGLLSLALIYANQIAYRPLAVVLSIAPALPIIGIFWAVGKLISEMQDEYLRMLLVRQSLVATAFALSLATIWGFLENFGFVPHIEAYMWAVAWFAGLGVGQCVNWLVEPKVTAE